VLLRSLSAAAPVTAVATVPVIYGWRGASAGTCPGSPPLPVVARVRPFGASASSGPAPVLQLSTSFATPAVLDAAAAIQTELRYEAPDVPPVSAPDRASGAR